MSATVLPFAASSRRWWVLATVVAAQFMFVVDAFIVNVALPSIQTDLAASDGDMRAVIAIYQIAFATLVITGGRLGDLFGRKRLFLIGLLGFTAASLWCGLAQSGTELVLARLVQGGAAALMSPQVLATIHTLFPDSARTRAFAAFGIALGLGGAVGLLLGGWLVTWNIGGFGWRAIFFVNVPVGAVLALEAMVLLPTNQRRTGQTLDLHGAAVLFLGLVDVIAPVLWGAAFGWAWWLWAIEVGGFATLFGFLRLERRVARRGGLPLIDLDLLADRAFLRGLGATAWFFAANISFYLVITLFQQLGLHRSPFQAGLTVLPLALAFVVASRRGAPDGVHSLIRGCWFQLAGLLATAVGIDLRPVPEVVELAIPLTVFGYGQGLVMAPLFGTVLASVRRAHAGSGAGILTTVQQIANAGGVAVIGGLYAMTREPWGDTAALMIAFAALALAILTCAALLRRMAAASAGSVA